MPIYEYRCDDCEHQFEALQKMSDDALLDCPACNQSALKKLLSAGGFRIGVSQNYCFAAEVGLSGEIRPIPKAEQRIQEASKLGFDTIIISKFTKISDANQTIKIVRLGKIEELITYLFG